MSEEVTANVPEQPRKPGWGVSIIQLFGIPALIVAVCVVVYLLFRFISAEPGSLEEILDRLHVTTGHERAVVMLQATQYLRAAQRDEKERMRLKSDARIVERITKFYNGLNLQDSDDFLCARYAIETLGLLQNPAATPFLIGVLEKSGDSVLKSGALDAIGSIKDQTAYDAVEKCTRDPDPWVRKFAAFNLGALQVEKGRTRLVEMLTDDDREVQLNAAFALAVFFKDASGKAQIKTMLSRKQLEAFTSTERIVEILKKGCVAAAALESNEFRPEVNALAVGDPDEGVRNSARLTLEHLK